MDTDNDFDNDGNNIVPCPICLNIFCPSKEGGKCPEEDDFKASFTPTVDSSVDWEKEFDEKFYSKYQLNDVLIPKYEMTNAFLEELKDFIRTNRQSLITRIKGEVEKMELEETPDVQGGHFHRIGYNKALYDLLTRIDKIV